MKKLFAFLLAMVMLTACIPCYAESTDLVAGSSSTQVAVSGDMGAEYANKPLTILLLDSVANPETATADDIRYIYETQSNASGRYDVVFNASNPAACTVYVKCGDADVTQSVLSATAKITYDMSIDIILGQKATATFSAKNPFGATVDTDETATLMVAFYNDEDVLIDFMSEDYNVSTNKVFKIIKECPEGTVKAKAFLWQDLKTLVPLHDPDEDTGVTAKPGGEILILGNSFSVDSTAYVHEIAKNMGYDLNLHLLQVDGTESKEMYDVLYDDIYNGGGAYWGYSYMGDGTSLATQEPGFNLRTRYTWIKDDNKPKAVAVPSWLWKVSDLTSKYDFDVIVIQDYWGMGENLLNYNYTPGRDTDGKWYAEVAKLLQKIEPNAEIMINSVWVNEMGYLSNVLTNNATSYGWTTDNFGVQSFAYDQMEKFNGQAAIDVGKIVNPDQSPIRQLPVGYAVQLARHWQDPKTGDYKFRTTYHMFNENDDGKYLPMGADDTAHGRMRLNRDGFHSSFAARYLEGLVWVEVLTGADVRDCTYIPPEGSWQLSAIDSQTGDTLNYKVTVKFPELTTAEADIFQDIAHQAVKNFTAHGTRSLTGPAVPFTFDK